MHAPWVLAARAAAKHELTALATAVLTAVVVDWDRAAPPVEEAEAEADAMAVAVAVLTSSLLQVAAAVELLAMATAKPSEMAVAVTYAVDQAVEEAEALALPEPAGGGITGTVCVSIQKDASCHSTPGRNRTDRTGLAAAGGAQACSCPGMLA
jgi:hypothetical protein